MLLLLLSFASQFLVITVDHPDGEKVIVNVPRELVKSAIVYAKESDSECFNINGSEISTDSIINLIERAESSDDPIIEVQEGNEVVKIWLKDAESIVDKKGKPGRLVIEVDENNESSVKIRLPLLLVRALPSFIIPCGENKKELRMARRLIKDVLEEVSKLDGGFTLVDVMDGDEKVKIKFD